MARDLPTLPRFRDVFVHGGAASYDDLVAVMTESLEEPWERDTEIEGGDFLRNAGDFRVFHRLPSAFGPELRLYLVPRPRSRDLYVSNIVPVDARLSYDEYNQALDQFVDIYLAPACNRVGLKLSRTEERFDIRRELGNDVADAISSFSAGANKSTGNSHPSDRDRWNHMVFVLYKAAEELSPTDLGRWLEADGWPSDIAAELAIEYEGQLALLRYVDDHR